MNIKRTYCILQFLAALLVASSAAAADWHHVHLRVPNPAEGAAWYAKFMEGEVNRNAAVFGKTTINFLRGREDFAGSAGSVIDHIGWSFNDLGAKLKDLEAAGVKILAQPRTLGAVKFAFIEDPWGTKIEVLEDAGLLGFHHVHLYMSDPVKAQKWYVDVFGGKEILYLDRIIAVDYGAMKLFIATRPGQTALAPSEGRSLDHIGWSVADLDEAAVELKAKGIVFTLEPRSLGRNLKISYIEGPEGVRIEILQLGSR